MTHIDRPIFIIGCPRSGTTVFYNLMSRHPDLAFLVSRYPDLAFHFSNLRFPKNLRQFGRYLWVNGKYLRRILVGTNLR